MKRREHKLGSAVRPDQLVADSRPAQLVLEHCDFLVPEYHSQWSAIEWERGRNWFGDLDAITDFANANELPVRGHSLIWEQMTPEWARQAMADREGWSVVRDHFSAMLTRYDHRTVPEWIVVNECIDTVNGEDNLRRTSFQRAFGGNYVRAAFETAHEFAPHARLYINEYSIEYDNPIDEARRSALLRLVERLRHDNVPVHGVGIQAHLELAKGPLARVALVRFIRQLADMGLDVAITELDVLEADRHASVAQRDMKVADATREFLDTVHAARSVGSVATWGLFDHDSWLQEHNPATQRACKFQPVDCVGLNRGLPYAGDYAAKPMLDVVFT